LGRKRGKHTISYGLNKNHIKAKDQSRMGPQGNFHLCKIIGSEKLLNFDRRNMPMEENHKIKIHPTNDSSGLDYLHQKILSEWENHMEIHLLMGSTSPNKNKGYSLVYNPN
jgi:hypothetical protein